MLPRALKLARSVMSGAVAAPAAGTIAPSPAPSAMTATAAAVARARGLGCSGLLGDKARARYPNRARACVSYSCITDRMLPAGSLNQAMSGPCPRATPFSSWSNPS